MNTANPRVPWPDYTKGMAILLVVLGHLILGMGLTSFASVSEATDGGFNGWRFAVQWIYAFHMQVFFFISGLLAQHSSRKTAGGFIVAKLRTIAYPYFLWSVLQILLMLSVAGQTRHEVRWLDLLTIIYRPVMQFWFLYALFFIFVLFAVLRKLRFNATAILAFSITLFFCDWFLLLPPLWANLPGPLWNVLHWVCSGMIYFGAGVYASRWALEGLARLPARRLTAAAAASCLLLTLGVGWISTIEWPERNMSWAFACVFLLTPVLAFLGIVMLSALGKLASRCRPLDTLRLCGVLSLEIYVAHTMATAGTRIVLSRVLHVENVWLQLAAGMFAGVFFPVLLWWACRKIGFPYMFTLPERRPHGG